MFDDILERVGLKYEDLSDAELETLNGWESSLNQKSLNINSVSEYIDSMIEAVQKELTSVDLNRKQDIFLKARLRNYLLLKDFMSSPQKAQAAVERAIAGIAVKKVE